MLSLQLFLWPLIKVLKAYVTKLSKRKLLWDFQCLLLVSIIGKMFILCNNSCKSVKKVNVLQCQIVSVLVITICRAEQGRNQDWKRLQLQSSRGSLITASFKMQKSLRSKSMISGCGSPRGSTRTVAYTPAVHPVRRTQSNYSPGLMN